MQNIKLNKDTGGWYTCEVPITKDDWADMLRDKTVASESAMTALLSFYFLPGHGASCTKAAEEYGRKPAYYTGSINGFCRNVQKRFTDFRILSHDSDEQIFWPVCMARGKNTTDGFVWYLRPELIEALRDRVVTLHVEQYARELDSFWHEEVYKWQAIKTFRAKWDIEAENFADMLSAAMADTDNLLASMNAFPLGMLERFAQADAERLREMFRNLFDESKNLEERFDSFVKSSDEMMKKYFQDLLKENRIHYQNTNAISTYLWLRYPEKYPIFKYSIYREVSAKLGLGVEIGRTGRPEEVVKGYQMYRTIWQYISSNQALINHVNKRLADEGYGEVPLFGPLATDFGYWLGKRQANSLKDSLKLKTATVMSPLVSKAYSLLRSKKNLILQGAPGTGKTYNTAALAVALIDGVVPEHHKDVMDRYDELREARRIGFTTFHQSMDYEDFVEGIKPIYDGGIVRYEVNDGVFKRMCKAAQVASDIEETGSETIEGLNLMNDNPTIWKVSLGGTGDNPIRKDCFQNGHIRISWEQYGDIDFSEDNPKVTEGKNILRTFYDSDIMKKGDIIVSCYSQSETDAIGIVTGDYEYRADGGEYPRYRDVKWFATGFKHNIVDINNGKRMTLGTVYRLSIDLKDILDVISKYAPKVPVAVPSAQKPYVLIIDEINRGNVSKIFGELITLLEADKRLGEDHGITLQLPYSKDEKGFGVPKNLYIIGTMNTTDRSTGTIDYAIRRRFAFLTIPAERELVKWPTAQTLFDDVKKFITDHRYADMDVDDLMVGHSYFMLNKENEAEENAQEMRMKMEFEIIPLIKEYIKDGILTIRPDEARKYFDSWMQLKPYNPVTPEEDDDDSNE